MDDRFLWALLAAVGLLVIEALCLFAAAAGDLSRLALACRAFWRTVRDQPFAAKMQALLAPEETKAPGPLRPSGVPLRMLAVLQREGRLLDFLLEDIQAYPDAQVGAAVRDIHRQCRAALKEHLVLEPVMSQPEGDLVEVPAGFDPSAIRVVGNVTGQPPFRGTLRHHGWRVRDVRLSPPPPGQDELVLMPAEVEVA